MCDVTANMMIKLHRNEEKTCVLKQAQFTCEAKMVCNLTPCERSLTLGLEQARDEDYAVRIKWDDNGMVGQFDYGTEKDMVVVRRGYIDHPFRDFIVVDNEMHLLVLHVEGSPRLAIDMLRTKSKLDSRIILFIKDRKQLHSYPAYDLNKIGELSVMKQLGWDRTIQAYQVRYWKQEKGRSIYGLITPWTKHKWLVIPLGRYSHPALPDEMWTERYLYDKKDSTFRAVYLFWNARIVDERTIKKSWLAYTIRPSEQELVKQMISWCFLEYHPSGKSSLDGMPINASPRVGAPAQKWEEQSAINPSIMHILEHHINEEIYDMNGIAPSVGKPGMVSMPILVAKKRIARLYGDSNTPNLFPEEDD